MVVAGSLNFVIGKLNLKFFMPPCSVLFSLKIPNVMDSFDHGKENGGHSRSVCGKPIEKCL